MPCKNYIVMSPRRVPFLICQSGQNMTKVEITFIIILTSLLTVVTKGEQLDNEFCDANDPETCAEEYGPASIHSRYILYDVNPPEGFNLRRDVYVRLSVFAHNLQNSKDDRLKTFKLVLPTWLNLYHWNSSKEKRHRPWSHFFDVESLQQFAPVIEMHQFFNEMGITRWDQRVHIDEVYVLQHFERMFESGNFEERMSIEDCTQKPNIKYYDYVNLTCENVRCLSFHGHVSQLSKLLSRSNARSIMFDHAEIVLHDDYGSKMYWQARRSMRFNKELVSIAEHYRHSRLNSSDASDNTVIPRDWRSLENIVLQGSRAPVGGPYLSVHLRRRDFLWGRPDHVPTIDNAAAQIKLALREQKLNCVFIATDAPAAEYDQLRRGIASGSGDGVRVFRYEAPGNVSDEHGDGGIAIIEQIICSHARYFIGTHESTFSFRIQEEREILGFPTDATFNRLCGDADINNCSRPSIWKVVY